MIKTDPSKGQEYEDVRLFSDREEHRNLSAADIGFDAVAKIRDEGIFCAVQRKFFAEGCSLKLFLQVITTSLKAMEIVRAPPKLEID